MSTQEHENLCSFDMKCIPDNANTRNRAARNNSLMQDVEKIKVPCMFFSFFLEGGGGGVFACVKGGCRSAEA